MYISYGIRRKSIRKRIGSRNVFFLKMWVLASEDSSADESAKTSFPMTMMV